MVSIGLQERSLPLDRYAQARADGHVVVRVKDNGRGISPEALPAVFDLFVQADRAPDRAEGGLGIGLTLARSLVEAHGGVVAVQSAGVGRGSEFQVRLPAPPRRPGDHHATGADEGMVEANGTGLRVLLVDDNTDAADLLAQALCSIGHQVAVAYDGPEALAIAPGFAPHTALLDIGLPGMDGHELAVKLRQLFPDGKLRLIAVTGYGQESDRTRTAAAGFDLHLVKPVDLSALIASLDGRDQNGGRGAR